MASSVTSTPDIHHCLAPLYFALPREIERVPALCTSRSSDFLDSGQSPVLINVLGRANDFNVLSFLSMAILKWYTLFSLASVIALVSLQPTSVTALSVDVNRSRASYIKRSEGPSVPRIVRAKRSTTKRCSPKSPPVGSNPPAGTVPSTGTVYRTLQLPISQ